MFEMLEIMQKGILLFALFICAWIDWKKQQVYVMIPCLAGVLGLALHIFLQDRAILDLLLGTSMGAACVLAAFCTKESIGYGDGVIFILTGIFLGFWENLDLLMGTLMLAGAAALFFIVTKKKGRKDRMPVVPFVFAAYVLHLL